MNIVNKLMLYTVLAPRNIYTKLDINISHLESILITKLTIDDRRPNSMVQRHGNKEKKAYNFSSYTTIISSLILGLFFLLSFAISDDISIQLTLFFSFYIFMLSGTLISDFTSVLIDVRDNYIILPKPVNDKTIVVARLLHILIHVSKIALPMTIPSMIMLCIQQSIFILPLFLFAIVLATIFSLFLINAAYIFILKITTPKKFQSIISYVQIAFSILLYASYQVIPRFMAKLNIEDINFDNKPLLLLAPPYWFATFIKVFVTYKSNLQSITSTGLAIVVPFISIYIVIKYLAPSFNSKLLAINSRSEETVRKNGEKINLSKPNIWQKYVLLLAAIFTKKGVQRESFLFAWRLTSRSKDFMLKVYPSIGYMFVYGIVMFINSKKINLETLQQDVKNTMVLFIMAIYMFSFVLMTALANITFSEKWKASWIYYTTPTKQPGEIVLGSTKAVIFKFYFPLIAFISVLSIVFVGPSIIYNLIFGCLNVLLVAALIVYLKQTDLPFSKLQSASSKGGSFIKGLISIIFPVALGIAHYFLYKFTIVIILCSLLSIAAIWLIFDSVLRTDWLKVKRIDLE